MRRRYRLRRDKFVTEDGVKYTAYGIDVYEGMKKVRSIKDVSLNRRRMRAFIKQCEPIELEYIDEKVFEFVDDGFKMKSRTS